MITSVFKKSTPLNYALVLFLAFISFFGYQIQEPSWMSSGGLILKKGLIFLLVLAAIFLTSFVGKRNKLTRDSSYTAFFYLLLLLFFPSVFSNLNIVFANLFTLLALRCLISLQSMKASKEKIFDASLWIFVASLFHFWCILFLVLVFISIIFHTSRDYTNWFLPFVGFFTVGVLFLVFASFFEIDIADYLSQNTQVDLAIDYFPDVIQNIAFSIYVSVALFFVCSILLNMSNRPSISQLAYKKVVVYFFIAAIVFGVSPNKSSDFLLMTIAPLAVLASSCVEYSETKLKQEMILGLVFLCGFILFVAQL